MGRSPDPVRIAKRTLYPLQFGQQSETLTLSGVVSARAYRLSPPDWRGVAARVDALEAAEIGVEGGHFVNHGEAGAMAPQSTPQPQLGASTHNL